VDFPVVCRPHPEKDMSYFFPDLMPSEYLMLNKPLFPYAFPHFLLYFTDIIYKSEVLPCQQWQYDFLFCLRCCIIGLYDMPFYGWTGLCEKNKNGLHTLFWKEMDT